MNIRRIALIIAALMSGIGVFLPIYSMQMNGRTMSDGVVSLMPGLYGIVILLADIVVIGSTVVNLRKGFVISSLISIGVTIYAVANAMIGREGAAAIMRVTGQLLYDKAKVEIVDGPALVILIIAAVLMLITMLWNAFNYED